MTKVSVVDALWRDIKYAFRVLRRTPAFTMTAIATLALVIGANTSVFSLADSILLRPLPYPQPERLGMVQVEGQSTKGSGVWQSHDGTTWELLRDSVTAVDVTVIGASFGHDVNLVVGNTAMPVSQMRVGPGYFHVLGVAPVIGRDFTRDDDRPGGPAVCVISYPLWQHVFGGNVTAVGQPLLLRGERYDVIGVMPKGFENPGDPADVWTPVRAARTGEGGGTNFAVYARVKDGHTWQEAIAAMPALDADFYKRVTGNDNTVNFTGRFTMVPLQETLVSDVQQPIVMLGGAVFTVLLIACVNLAVLLLVRGGARTKEIATRMALGGGRRDVLRQLLVESVVLGLFGGALGLAVGALGLEALKSLGGTTFSQWTHVTLDARMVAFTLGLALFTCLLFGIVPAMQASRLDVQAALAEGGSRSIAGGSRPWLRRILVGAEVALGVALLVVTALLIRAFVNLRSIEPGFDPTHVVTTSVSLQDARYKSATQMNQLFDETVRRLEQTPGIESAAVSLELPYRRLLNMGFKFTDDAPDKGHIANVMYVTPDFFRTLRIPLVAGRTITTSDVPTSPNVVVVNQGFMRFDSDGKDPIGRRLRLSGAEREVVGIVGDVKVTSSGFFLNGMMKGPITSGPLIYLPAAQTPDGFLGMHIWFSPMWTVRASSPAVAEEALQRAVSAADPMLPLGRIQRMVDIQAAATARQRLLMILVGVLGGAAVLLAAIGIHGLIAHSVQQRTREFGIRLALGATAGGTIRDVAMSGVLIAFGGAVVGVGLAVLAVRVMENLVSSDYLWGVTSRAPGTYVEVALFLVAVAAVASLIPALRILRVDPAETLRA